MTSHVPPPDVIFCHECGTQWGADALYCRHCGTQLLWPGVQKKRATKQKENVVSSPPTKPQQPTNSQTSTQPKKPLMLDKQKVQYQPATGFSRLGRDIHIGDYVDVSQASRRQGLYIIGANGTGKTGLIENLMLQDINQGLGVGLLDPHGDLTNALLAKMTKREDDVILLDIQDEEYPFGINIFECSNPQSPTAVQKIVDLMMHIFEKLYDVSRQTPRMAQFLRNCTHTLVANPGYSMADIPLLLQDEKCRSKLLAQVQDPQVRLFWQTYNALKPSEQFDRAESTLNKMDELLQPLPRNIVGQAKTTVNIQQVMDGRKILLVKLSAQLDQVTSLVGTLIIALFLNAAYSRASVPINKRKQFNLYADEFQRFATEDFATLLTEARKFGIATTIAHQARYQPGMTDGIRAVTLQAANYVMFRVTSPDADELAGSFDLSPQEAWEEELEEEWVEVTKEEWFERVEEDVPDAEDAVITYKRDVVGHLLHQGHENPAVERFVSKHLQSLQRASQERPELNMQGGIAGKSVVYGTNTEVRSVDYIGEVFKESGYLPNGKYLSDEKLGMFERFYARFDKDNYGVYWYDPHIIQQDVLELNTFLFDAMRGKISDANNSLHTSGFLHGVGHWGLSTYLGFDTYYYVNYCLISPQVKEAYLHIMNFTRDYYSRKDIQFDRFGLSALSRETEEEYQRLGEELQKVNQKLETYRQFSLTPQQHHTIWTLSRFNETNKIYQYQVEGGGFSDCITSEDHKRIMSELYGLHDGFPGSEQWNKYQEAHAWAFTKYLCLRATKPIPSMRYAAQQEIAALMREKEAIEQRQDEFCGKDRYDDTRLSRLKGWCSKEIKPWLAALFRDTNACDLSIKAQVYDAEKNRYEWFVSSLLATVKALQQEPIQTRESGQYQPRTNKHITYLTHPRETITHPRVAITHPQRTYQDVKNDIANQLSSMPDFTARARITIEGQTVEHTIKTLEPEKGLFGKPLQERIESIQSRNRDPLYGGYCRPRKDVEIEITNRQTSYSGSAPVQSQQQTRHARTVQVQRNCPKCGKSNPTEAQFCNQCGTKL